MDAEDIRWELDEAGYELATAEADGDHVGALAAEQKIARLQQALKFASSSPEFEFDPYAGV